MKLFTRLTGLFLLISIIPLAVVGIVAYQSSQRIITQDMLFHLNVTTSLKATELIRMMNHLKESLLEFAGRPAVRRRTRSLTQFAPDTPAFQAAYFQLRINHVEPLLEQESWLELFLIHARTGKILLSSGSEPENAYRGNEPYFKNGQRDISVQNAYYSISRQMPVITVAAPVTDLQNGALNAVLAGHVDIEKLSVMLSEGLKQSNSQESYLVSAAQLLVSSSRFSAKHPGDLARSDGIAACLKQQSGSGAYRDYRGIPVLGVYRWIPEMRLCLLSEIDSAEAFARVRALRLTIVGIAAGVVAFVIMLALLMARSVSRPILRMLAGLDEIGQGNFAFRLNVHDHREIGQMESAINTMAARLGALTASRDELNREIEERRIAEQQMHAARDEAEAANRAKTEFLSTMSHELRTPLNAILGYSQILRQEKTLTELQQQAIQSIQESGEHLLLIINDLLDLSKLDAGRIQIIPREIHLPGFLKGIEDMIRIRAAQKGVQFLCQYPLTLPEFIVVDEQRLRQILLNLLGNAVKFTQQGRVTFRITRRDAENADASRQPVGAFRFEVEDTGMGIPAHHLDTIFLPFHQAESYLSHGQGTGLGLTISQRLANMMQTKIYVASVVNQGSRFWFDLALAEARHPAAPRATNAPRPAAFIEGNNRKILVVDDEDSNRLLLRHLLKPLGFQVIEAASGAQAVQQAAAESPHLILLDLNMADANGLETMRHIRAIPGQRAVNIIILSANSPEESRQACLDAGCQAFLSKPFNAEELLCALCDFLAPADMPPHPAEGGETLAPEALRALLDMAKIGDIFAIRTQLKTLQAQPCAAAPFLQTLAAYAKSLEISKIQALLQEALASLETRP